MDDFVPAQAQHLSLGVQRQVTSDFAVTADFAFRHYIHEKLRGVDLNHYNSVNGPVIPACPPALATVPGVACSNGPIQATISGGNGTYKALLVRADKRFSHRHSGRRCLRPAERPEHLRTQPAEYAHHQPE